MKFSGIALITDTPNKNGRIYPREVVEKALLEYQKQIDEKRSIGCIWSDDHYQTETIDLSKASHIVNSAKLDGNNLIIEAQTLKTPMGEVLAEIIENDKGTVPLWGLRPRGFGVLDENKKIGNYELISFDLLPMNKAS
jgi:hypothetical protein